MRDPSSRRRPHALVVFALAVVLFMAALDQTVVGTALPRIAADIGGLDWYTWVFTAYMLATTAAVPVAGKLGDLYGRRRLLVVGIVEFVLSSALAGLSPSMEVLVVMRGLQGIGAGVLAANAQAALGDLFPPAQLGKYNGMMSGVYALSSLVGPVLGGAITDWIGWRWVFLLNLPIGALALVVVLLQFRPRARSRERETLDLAGALVLVMAVLAALACFSGLERLDGGSPGAMVATIASGLAAVVLGLIFIRVERRAKAPIVPLELLAQRELRVILTLTGLAGLAVYTSAIFIPLMLQGALGLSPSAAGLALTPMVFGLVGGGITGGIAVSRRGHYKGVVVIGMVLAALAAGLLAHHAAAPTVLGTAGWLAALGLGVGLTMPSMLSGAQSAVAHSELGLVTSLAKFARTFGGIVGLGVLGAVLHVQLAGILRARLPDLLGSAAEGELATALARDPSAMLQDDTRELEALLPTAEPERVGELLALLREALVASTADILWALAGCLVICALWTMRLDGRPLRESFDEETTT
jgi:EmrB/QacA subfamily drug resistance transporter